MNDKVNSPQVSYQTRMRDELAQLKLRCGKIEDFLDTETYDEISDADQVLILAQSIHMAGYYELLSERVRRLDAD